MSSHARILFPLLTLVAVATAQEPAPATGIDLTRSLVVPLHTMAADPIGGEYGVWAAGAGYKASFHDGFALYPYLGADAPRHLPLQWRTQGMTAGGKPVPLGAGRARWSGCRFERDWGQVVEAYDVRAEGVEQTFILNAAVPAGDVVISGAVDTELMCAPRAPAGQELVFGDGRTPVIRYGRAAAFDAAGKTCEVLTAWDGRTIRLTVPGPFLEQARFPVVVDPLIGPVTLTTLPGFWLRPVITADPESVAGRILVAWSQWTGADHDLYVVSTDRNFNNVTPVFTDLTTWSSVEADVTWAAGPGLTGPRRWVVTLRRVSGSSSGLRVYLQDVASLTANTGALLSPATPPGFVDEAPSVGGSRSGGALMVADRVNTANNARTVIARHVDVAATALGAEVAFGVGLFAEPLRGARVTPMTLHGSGWVVAMLGTAGIRVARVLPSASGNLPTHLLAASSSTLHFDVHVGMPSMRVAGDNGRYLLAYVATLSVATSTIVATRAVRFDWPTSASTPLVLATRWVDSANQTQVGAALLIGGLEHDPMTDSHWVLAHQVYPGPSAIGYRCTRLGYSGGTVETQATPHLCDVAFASLNVFAGSFPVVYPVPSPMPATVVGDDFRYPADAVSVPYGTSCTGPGISVGSSPPCAGSEFFRVLLTGLAPGTPAIYALAFTMGSTDLTPSGMPGCFLNLGQPIAGTLSAVANASGTAMVTFALPDVPLVTGDVFSQWFHHDPAASPVPFRAAHGMRHQIR